MTTAMEWPVVFSLVSHELRSPAAVIAGYAHMLRQGQLGDDDRQKVLVQIERAAGTIQQVGRHASEVSRWLSAPASIPAVDHVSLGTLVTRAVARSASASRITTDFSAGVDAVPVQLLDREALSAALAAVFDAAGREVLDEDLRVIARPAETPDACDVLVGPSSLLSPQEESGELAFQHQEPLSLERGGLGLSLVVAAIVIEIHGGHVWAARGQRRVVGVTLVRET